MNKEYFDIINNPHLPTDLREKIQKLYRKETNTIKQQKMLINGLKNKVEIMKELVVFNIQLESVCTELIKVVRWGKEMRCPHCDYDIVYSLKDYGLYSCGFCHKKFSIIDDTFFRNTKIPIQKWFHLIFLAVKDAPQKWSGEILNLTQASLWRSRTKIRELSDIKQLNNKLNKLANGK